MGYMSFKIVVDSCCDLSPQMLKDPCFVKVPLTIRSNGSTFVDDEGFDQADLLWSDRAKTLPLPHVHRLSPIWMPTVEERKMSM